MTGTYLLHALQWAARMTGRSASLGRRPPRNADPVYRIHVPKRLRHLGRAEAIRVMRGEGPS